MHRLWFHRLCHMDLISLSGTRQEKEPKKKNVNTSIDFFLFSFISAPVTQEINTTLFRHMQTISHF